MNPIEEAGHTRETEPSTLRARVTETPSRVDVYEAPHRTLRYMLANLLVDIGRASFAELEDTRAVLADLKTALWACDTHIEHEDNHLRPLLLERAPSATTILDSEHTQHAEQVAELRAIAKALEEAATSGARTALGQTLYLHFSVFVAETLAHMAYEERVVQPLLDRLCKVEELERIHGAIIASIPPQDMFVWLQAMIPSANRTQRRELMGMVRASAPPEVVASLLQTLKPVLSVQDWTDLNGTVAA